MEFITAFLVRLVNAIQGKEAMNFKPRKNAAAMVEEFKPKFKALSYDQLQVFEEVLFGDSNCVVVTGKAGSGKSYVLLLLSDLLNTLFDLTCVKSSPTGINAVSIKGQTVNSLFKLGGGDLLPYGIKDNGPRGVYQRKSPIVKLVREKSFEKGRDAVVIVDEAFCCSSEVLVIICQLMAQINKRTKFVLVGDPAQLPPVDKKEVGSLKKVSKAWAPARFETQDGQLHTYCSILEGAGVRPNPNWKTTKIALTTNHRQGEDAAFAAALNYLATGGKLEGPAKFLETRFMSKKVQPLDYGQALHIYPSVRKVAALNEEAIANAIASGAEHADYPTYSEWVGVKEEGLVMAPLAVGLPFMVRLNLDNGLSNGSRGTIVQLNKDNVVVKFGSKNIALKLTSFRYGPIGPDGQPIEEIFIIPGHLSSAITGHKVQGLTIDGEVVLHLDHQDRYLRNQPGWLYVACSRTRTPEQLFIDSPKSVFNEVATACPEALEFRASCYKTDETILGEVTPEAVEAMRPTLYEYDSEKGLYQFVIWTTDGQQADLVYIAEENSYLFFELNDEEGTPMTVAECNYHADCQALIKGINTKKHQEEAVEEEPQEQVLTLQEYHAQLTAQSQSSNEEGLEPNSLDKLTLLGKDEETYNLSLISFNNGDRYEFSYDSSTNTYLFGGDAFEAGDFPYHDYAQTCINNAVVHEVAPAESADIAQLESMLQVEVEEPAFEVEPEVIKKDATEPDVELYELVSFDWKEKTAVLVCHNQTQGTDLEVRWDGNNKTYSIGAMGWKRPQFPGDEQCQELLYQEGMRVLDQQAAEHAAAAELPIEHSGLQWVDYSKMDYEDIPGIPYPMSTPEEFEREFNESADRPWSFYGREGVVEVSDNANHEENYYIIKGDMMDYRIIRVGRMMVELKYNKLTFDESTRQYAWEGVPCTVNDKGLFAWVCCEERYYLFIKDRGIEEQRTKDIVTDVSFPEVDYVDVYTRYDISEFSNWLLHYSNEETFKKFRLRCNGDPDNNFYGVILSSEGPQMPCSTYDTPEGLAEMSLRKDGVPAVLDAIAAEVRNKGITPEVVELTYKATCELEAAQKFEAAAQEFESVEHQTLIKETTEKALASIAKGEAFLAENKAAMVCKSNLQVALDSFVWADDRQRAKQFTEKFATELEVVLSTESWTPSTKISSLKKGAKKDLCRALGETNANVWDAFEFSTLKFPEQLPNFLLFAIEFGEYYQWSTWDYMCDTASMFESVFGECGYYEWLKLVSPEATVEELCVAVLTELHTRAHDRSQEVVVQALDSLKAEGQKDELWLTGPVLKWNNYISYFVQFLSGTDVTKQDIPAVVNRVLESLDWDSDVEVEGVNLPQIAIDYHNAKKLSAVEEETESEIAERVDADAASVRSLDALFAEVEAMCTPVEEVVVAKPVLKTVVPSKPEVEVTTKAIHFYGYKGEYGGFSNFSYHPFTLDGKSWATNEHYFQAQKFLGSDEAYMTVIANASTPAEAARLGKSRSHPLRKDWEQVKDSVMLTGVTAKFSSNVELQTLLINTGDVELVENSPSDFYWGCGSNKTGKNMLGKTLMQVRELLRNSGTQVAKPSKPGVEEVTTILAVPTSAPTSTVNNPQDVINQALALVEATANAAAEAAEQARIASEHASVAANAAKEAVAALRLLLTTPPTPQVEEEVVVVAKSATEPEEVRPVGTLEVSTVYVQPTEGVTPVYIGRANGSRPASPLGNYDGFVDKAKKGGALKTEHENAVAAFESTLTKEASKAGYSPVMNGLNSIASLLKQGKSVALQCYCKTPKNGLAMGCAAVDVPCHGDAIKSFILNNLV